MYVTIRVYRAREGEEDALVSLHEDWQRHRHARAGGWLWGELLHDTLDPQRFTAIARYESVEAAQAAAHDPEYAAWKQRLESLCQAAPECREYEVVPLLEGPTRRMPGEGP